MVELKLNYPSPRNLVKSCVATGLLVATVLYSLRNLFKPFLYYYIVPLIPTGFKIINESFLYDVVDAITFVWDVPTGGGPESVVDQYFLAIRDTLTSLYKLNRLVTTPWVNMNLFPDREYEATLTARNCVGESSRLIRFEYSE